MGVILVFILTVFLTTMIKCLKFFLKIEKNKKKFGITAICKSCKFYYFLTHDCNHPTNIRTKLNHITCKQSTNYINSIRSINHNGNCDMYEHNLSYLIGKKIYNILFFWKK